MKKYTIKTILGDDILSPEYLTHQEAMWNLCNNTDYSESGSSVEERKKVLYISCSESWLDEVVPCQYCGKDAAYLDQDMDVIECIHCIGDRK